MNNQNTSPIIDRVNCDGEASCISACPHGVLVLEKIHEEDRLKLSAAARFKVWVNGSMQAYVINHAECQFCGECEKSCRRGAIKLKLST